MSNSSVETRTATTSTIIGSVLLVSAVLGGLFGFAWTVVFYVSQGMFPLPALGSWNLVLGGFFFVAGIPMLVVGILLLVSGSRRRKKVTAQPAASA